MLTSVAYANNKQKPYLLTVQRTTNVRSDFEERFGIFKRMYDMASTKEEKNHIAKEFLTHCTEDEVTLVRSVIDEILHHR